MLLALLRVSRPETLKEYAPDDLGHIVGLDRMPEVKTLRRKLAGLAQMKKSRELGRELAQRRQGAWPHFWISVRRRICSRLPWQTQHC